MAAVRDQCLLGRSRTDRRMGWWLHGTAGQAGLNGQHGRTSRNPKRPLSPCACRLPAVAQTAGTVWAAVTYDAAAHHVCVSSGEDGSAAYLAGRSDQHGELNGFWNVGVDRIAGTSEALSSPRTQRQARICDDRVYEASVAHEDR